MKMGKIIFFLYFASFLDFDFFFSNFISVPLPRMEQLAKSLPNSFLPKK